MASVREPSSAARIDTNPERNHAEILDVIRDTFADVGLKHAAAARLAGVPPSQFSEALGGKGNFGATWLWAQDNTFWLRLIANVMTTRQLTPESQQAIKRQRIVELIDLLLAEAS